MVVAMHPPTRARERILLIGPWGGGKSNAWAKVYEHMVHTSDALRMPGKLYVADTDIAVARVCPDLPDDQWRDLDQWKDYIEALTYFRSVATTDDWLVVDHISKAWEKVQEHYIQEIYGKASSAFFMEWKQDGAGGSPLADGFGTNWQVINKLYGDFITLVLRWPGHVLACAPSENITQPNRDGKGGDAKEIRDAYGRYGVKPAGQKSLGFQFLSVIQMIPKGEEEWVMTSMKDVKRTRPQNQPVHDFVMDYLVGVAGWELT